MIYAIVIAALALVAFFVVGRLNEIFCVSVRGGRVLLVRGSAPAALLQAFGDVARISHISRATIRGVRAANHARLVVSGVDEGTAQRLRNVFGTHHWSSLRSQLPRPSSRNLGQLLGIAWLAWLLVGRR